MVPFGIVGGLLMWAIRCKVTQSTGPRKPPVPGDSKACGNLGAA